MDGKSRLQRFKEMGKETHYAKKIPVNIISIVLFVRW